MKKIVLCLILGVFMLFGCGKKEAEAIQDDTEVEREPAVPETKEKFIKDEPVVDEPEEPVEGVDSEKEKETPSEFDLQLQEYFESARDAAYHSYMILPKYKFSYYAEDIDNDGFPEIFELGIHDETATIQDLRLRVYGMYPYRAPGTSKISYMAAPMDNIILLSRKNIEDDPQGGIIEFHYTADGKNIWIHTESRGWNPDESGQPYDTKIKDLMYVYKDHEVLKNGSKVFSLSEIDMEGVDPVIRYLVIDASGKYYYDEEHYNHLEIGSYDKTLTFTERFGWFSVDEAIEHLGELP